MLIWHGDVYLPAERVDSLLYGLTSKGLADTSLHHEAYN